MSSWVQALYLIPVAMVVAVPLLVHYCRNKTKRIALQRKLRHSQSFAEYQKQVKAANANRNQHAK